MTEETLADAIKKAFLSNAKRDPKYRLIYGKEVLTGEQAASRMDTDPAFREYWIRGFLTRAVDLAKEEEERE